MTSEQEKKYLLRIHDLEKQVSRLQTELKKNSETDYGLRWMNVPEAFEEASENAIPTLEEVKEKAISNDDGKPTHILIEGDNYHALTCLNYTHKGKIDVIYIDPPYNTGSDGFVYRDKRILDKFPDGTPVPKDHPLRHSMWLSFMNKRLRLAKNLLKEDGVIFISINEDEHSQLKLLCDDIFNGNYITSFTIKVRHEDRILKGDKPIHETTEQLLMYSRTSSFQIQKREKDNSQPDEYVYQIEELIEDPTEIEMGGKKVFVFRPNEYKIKKVAPNFSNLKKINIRGSIKTGNSSGRFHMKHLEPLNNEFNVLYKVLDIGEDGLGYRYFLTRRDAKQSNGFYFQGAPLNRQDIELIPYPNFFDFEDEFNNVGIEGGVPFDGGKKAIAFIQQFVKIAFGNKPITILDFFAGSGSTMHSIVDYQNNSQSISIQSPDLTYQVKDGKEVALKGCENVFHAGYKRIVDVTYQRFANVIQGYTNSRGKQIAGYGNSMKYYRTAFVGEHIPSEASDQDKTLLAQKAGCLLALSENTLEEICATQAYQIFALRNGDKPTNNCLYTAVYFSGNYANFGELRQEIEKLQAEHKHPKIAVYVFCWGDPSVFENEFDDMQGLVIKDIPQPILDIYNKINA